MGGGFLLLEGGNHAIDQHPILEGNKKSLYAPETGLSSRLMGH